MEKILIHSSFQDFEIQLDPPSICPVCGNSIAPKFIYSKIDGSSNSGFELSNLYGTCYAAPLMYKCTHRDCGQYYLLNCIINYYAGKDSFVRWESNHYQPPVNIKFSDEITNMSPEFVATYTQAFKAEKWELDNISGMGYRRSLEFLVKDYLSEIETPKNKNDEEYSKDDIYQMSLSSAIKLLPSQDLIDISKASAWLGNDESHTFKKWEEFDVSTLKEFIDSTVAFINFKIKASNASKNIIHAND